MTMIEIWFDEPPMQGWNKAEIQVIAAGAAKEAGGEGQDAKREGYLLGWKALATIIRAHFPDFDDARVAQWADKLQAAAPNPRDGAAGLGR